MYKENPSYHPQTARQNENYFSISYSDYDILMVYL